jgi:hypothetical protein
LPTTVDIIAFQRGELKRKGKNYVASLLDLLQNDSLRELDVVNEGGYNQILQDRKTLSATIASEVEAKQRTGFGVLVVTNKAIPVCLVASDLVEQFGLEELVQRERATISRHLRLDLSFLDLPVDTTFVALTKEQCGYVAGDAESLRKLMVPLRREGKRFEFAPLWFSDDRVREVGTAVLKKVEAEKQAKEDRNRMDEAARKQREAQRQVIEAGLRKQYSPRAIGLRDRVQGLIKQTADKPLDGTRRRARETEGTFPYFSNWLNKRFDDQWETTEVRSDVEDYGTVQWKDRNLEGVIVRASISQKNAIQGVRRTECFMFGFVEDVEFSMSRDLFDVDCEKSNNIVAAWKARRVFNSLWRAP